MEKYLFKRSKFSEIFEKAEECGISSSDEEAPINFVLHNLKNKYFNKYVKNHISFINCDINFLKMCQKIKNNTIKEYLENMFCNYYTDDESLLVDDFLCEKISLDCYENKIIFLNISAGNYCLDRDEDGNYAAHAICAILVPSKNNQYSLYYMNPHGEVMLPYTYFEEYVTRKRAKIYDFKKNTVDFVVINSIVNFCNTNLSTNIYFDNTKKHNYYGVNLQEEDNHGICFIFPSVVYYYLCVYFTEERELEYDGVKKIIPSFQNMLENGDFNLAMHSCFMDFDRRFKKCIFDILDSNKNHEDIVEELIKCLDISKYRFIKNLTHAMVSFLYDEYKES